jgi:hypothetical protein
MQLARKSKPSLLDNPYFCVAMKIAKSAHYFKKIERCFCSYQRPNRLFLLRKYTNALTKNVKKTLKLEKKLFQLPLWDARIGRWLTIDPKGQSDIKSLTGGGGKTINGVTYKWEIKLTGQKWSTWCLWEYDKI